MSDSAEFENWLEARAPRSAWASLNLDDLRLVFRVLREEAPALAELERRLARLVTAAAARDGEEFMQEVTQRARQRLLVGPEPRLARYEGRGALAVYLKAVVLSLSVDLRRAHRPREALDEGALLAAAAAEESADARLAHAAYKTHFTRAFRDALAAMTAEERNCLRLRFVEGLSVEAIGAAFGVHRTTAMRWLEKAQAALLKETRRRLAEQLKLPVRELDELMRSMRPSLAESISRLLPKRG